MFPLSFRKRIEQQQYIDSDGLIHALGEPSPVTIRINREKWNKEPLNTEPVPWCRDGFYLESRPSFTFDPLFHAGGYYPQEASGMFLEEIFRQLKFERESIKILDLCGAPGGKSTHLSSLLGNNGLLVSNEVIKTRALILSENLTKWGISNVIVTQSDPSSFVNLPGFFNLVLVDTPCSGEGMFRDAVAVNEWSVENAAMCSDRQKRILMDVWPAIKENGILIYSTCTFNPAENEKNIKWLTERKGAETVRLDMSEFEGITEISHLGNYGYGFYPGKIRGEGLFISVLRKKEKIPDKALRAKRVRFPKITSEEIKIASGLMDFKAENLIRYHDELISIPCNYNDYQVIHDVLRIVKAGTHLCKLKATERTQDFAPRRLFPRKFVPLHDLALSVRCKTGSYPLVDLSFDQALSYLSRGQLAPDKIQKGWNIVHYNGVNLGFINNIGSRINNYYPMEWRIRMDPRKNQDDKLIKWHP